jgi:hypothetical protein
MHPKQHPKQLQKQNSTRPLWGILLACGLYLQVEGQELAPASWYCGPYSSQGNNAPPGSGSTVSYSSDTASANQGSVYQDMESAYVIFSAKGYTFDANGNVSGYETTVRPSAGAQASVSWAGPASPTALREGGGPAAQGVYYARISPKAGAPIGLSVPLNIHVMGFAQCDTSDLVAGWNSYASASSSVGCSGGSINGSADATSDLPYADYDQSGTLLAQVGETISGSVWVQAVAMCNAGGTNSSNGNAQAFADPSIDIDPTFAYKDQFYLEYRQDNLFVPLSPLQISIEAVASLASGTTNTTSGGLVLQLTGPTNVVYELEAATSFPATQWLAIGTVTNTAGTLSFTNSQVDPASAPQGFYRARALRKAQ